MNITLKCNGCEETFRYIDDVVKIEDEYYCLDCKVPVRDIVGYVDSLDDSNWTNADDVETGNLADFGFYEEELEE